MEMHDNDTKSASEHSDQNASVQHATPWYRNLFSIPPPMKRVFDKFPMVSYEANELPLRAPRLREDSVLHVFTTEEHAKTGQPSFNPSCAKWQTYLKFNDIEFRTVPSSNHASPSGVLPFLLPGASESKTSDPIPGNKLKKWTSSQKQKSKKQEPTDIRYETYASLLDNRIRKAWLFQLYLTPSNEPLLRDLYVSSCSSFTLVQKAILYQLRGAAETELVKSSASGTIVEADIMRDAAEAFEALSELLSHSKTSWFLDEEEPGLFDASAFAYTYLILDESMKWKGNKLGEMLQHHQNLVQHQQRIMASYF